MDLLKEEFDKLAKEAGTNDLVEINKLMRGRSGFTEEQERLFGENMVEIASMVANLNDKFTVPRGVVLGLVVTIVKVPGATEPSIIPISNSELSDDDVIDMITWLYENKHRSGL